MERCASTRDREGGLLGQRRVCSEALEGTRKPHEECKHRREGAGDGKMGVENRMRSWSLNWMASPRTIKPGVLSGSGAKHKRSETLCHFSYTRDAPAVQMVSITGGKAALLVCMKNRSWESLGKAVCTACLPSN